MQRLLDVFIGLVMLAAGIWLMSVSKGYHIAGTVGAITGSFGIGFIIWALTHDYENNSRQQELRIHKQLDGNSLGSDRTSNRTVGDPPSSKEPREL